MRLSLKFLAFGVLATKTTLIHAGPCKPSPITSIDESSSIIPTTTAINSDDGMTETSALSERTTTSDISGDTSITTIDQSTTDSATTWVSSTATISEALTTTASHELTGSETLSGSQTTTVSPEESTSSALDLPTTTSVEAPLGTSLNAIFIDEGYEKEVWLSDAPSPHGSITSNEGVDSSGALFGLDPRTSRLYAILPSGEKLYAATCVQCSRSGLMFITEEQRRGMYFVFFITCKEGENRYLDCAPQPADSTFTHVYFYELGGYYMQTRYSDRNGGTAVEFRLG